MHYLRLGLASLAFSVLLSPVLAHSQQYMKQANVTLSDFNQLVQKHELLKCQPTAHAPYPEITNPPATSIDLMAGAASHTGACYRDIDRTHEISPPPLVLHAGTRVFIRILNPRPDEALVAAVSFSKIAPPSPGNDALKNAVNPLQAITLAPIVHGAAALVLRSTALCDTTKPGFDIEKCQKQLGDEANSEAASVNHANAALTCLENFQVPVASTPPEALPITPSIQNYTCGVASPIDQSSPTNNFANQRTIVKGVLDTAVGLPLPIDSVNALDKYLASAVAPARESLTNQATIKGLVAQIQTQQVALQQDSLLLAAMPATQPTQILYFDVPSLTTVTATIMGTQFISKTANTLATWTTSSTSYWVVLSAGLGFSNLVYRTYASTPQVQNGMPVLNGSGNALSIVTETDTPLSVMAPEVMGSVLIPKLGVLNRCSFGCSFLATGGIGANLTTKMADFDAGLSLRLSDVLFTPAVHFGHESRLTDGITVGSQLGANAPSTLPTISKRVRKFGFVLTYVIPLS